VTKKKTKVFVSYSRHDEAVVKPLAGLLGVATDDAVFLDVTSLKPGDLWDDKIISAVKDSTVFIICWCCQSEKSTFVAKEIAAALASGNKKLVPVLFCSTPLPATLSSYQWIDLRGKILHNCEHIPKTKTEQVMSSVFGSMQGSPPEEVVARQGQYSVPPSYSEQQTISPQAYRKVPKIVAERPKGRHISGARAGIGWNRKLLLVAAVLCIAVMVFLAVGWQRLLIYSVGLVVIFVLVFLLMPRRSSDLASRLVRGAATPPLQASPPQSSPPAPSSLPDVSDDSDIIAQRARSYFQNLGAK
jgi:hypothetical protein